MSETNQGFVTRRQFRLAAIGLAVPLLASLALLLAPWLGFKPKSHRVGILSGTPHNTTILVRGGSMTAFVVSSNPMDMWKTVNSTTRCLDIGTSNITSVQFTDEGTLSSPQVWPDPHAPPVAITSWEVKIYGHEPSASGYSSGTTHGIYGFDFISQQKSCSEPQGKTSNNISILVTIMGDYSQFYSKGPLPKHGYHTDNLRFWYNNNTQDEEFCERISLVEVTINEVGMAPQLCPDGDCSISIGVPQ
jgi:hypothetical protein